MTHHAGLLEQDTAAAEVSPVEAQMPPVGSPPERPPDDAVCEVCGCTNHVPVARQREWTLRRCRSCGLIFVFPQPTPAQLAAIYARSAGYFATAETELSRTPADAARRLHDQLVAAGIDGRRFLDVGCATGQLIYHMARLGWQATGLDVNADALAVARAHGLDVAEGVLEEPSLVDALFDSSFDVIHMGDVLEHVPRPRETLLTARRLLRPGGLLVLKTPNADCGFARASFRLARAFRVRWAWSAAPYHLYEFCPETISRLLEDVGLEVSRFDCAGRPAFLYTLGASGFLDELKRRLKRSGRYRFDWRLIASVPKLLGVGLLLLPAFVYGILAGRRHRMGYKMVATARRPSTDSERRPASDASPELGAPAQRRASIVGVTFDLLRCEQARAAIESWRQRGDRHYITFSNPHSVMMARRDEALSRAFRNAGMTLPDGAGIIMAAKLLGYPNHGRITGPSFMLACCDQGRQHAYRHYFCGGGEGVAHALAARLAAQFPGLRVVGTCCPPFRALSPDEDEALVARINAAKPDIVWVGLGAPKQERWMAAHVRRIDATAMVGVGAAFDFHARRASWAPRWVRRLGIEWVYRLAREPRRLWRRNLDSPLFLLAATGQWIRRLFGTERAQPRGR